MLTGVECGIAPSDTIHIAGTGKAGTLCDARPNKRFRPAATLAELNARALGTPCTLCSILAEGAAYEARRQKAAEKAAGSDARGREEAFCHIARVIARRWERAGYTTVRLEDGLPRPERPHPADWQDGGYVRVCGVCALRVRSDRAGANCPGPTAVTQVLAALERGVPFGPGPDGLPMAGVAHEPGDIVAKLSRATCTPRVPPQERPGVPTQPDPALCDTLEECAICDAPTALWTALPDRAPGAQVAICQGCAKTTAPAHVPTKTQWIARTTEAA